ncbi:MAG: twin-arginine translocase TatA/TatE family subunit [Cryomorphaceae bacterium]|nr:MAG: twin-arginine translocase TatA/TatE family subunit [Cryomorphaceae bacterium]
MIYLFFNISGGEIFVIALIAIMFFGKKGIPNVARTLGKGVRQFRDATQEIQRDILDSTRDIQDEVKKQQKDFRDQIKP